MQGSIMAAYGSTVLQDSAAERDYNNNNNTNRTTTTNNNNSRQQQSTSNGSNNTVRALEKAVGKKLSNVSNIMICTTC
jgi:hypothetical protein